MENLVTVKMLNNTMAKIFMKNMKKIRELNTAAAKEITDVYNEEKRIFTVPKDPVDTDTGTDSTNSESGKLDAAQRGISDTDIEEPPPLETEQEAAQRQQARKGLTIMTPKQMITRLPILLAQLKADNNSQKLKNEIRQITYSLYSSKNLSKTVYSNLINTT